ncbi:Uu.00g001920.m01.CDS01 [Anthostomella pinea]|uniref:Uu.00g001920.m01.CDS01 n=1 Tax=Anthostomella pinea TaxID=933095 RepID=A0AAI8YIP6_9PEZI|nr:Uu.00g001920.m01.CDS01 [Anthostomella pinea]
MALSELNNISIAEIAVYLPALFVAILLSVRHGFRRSVGWTYVVVFSLVRIIGASLELATINDPKNTSLYIGYITLQSIGLSPLILTQLGLVNRVLQSVEKARAGWLNPNSLRIIQIIVLVGLILGAVGGSDAGSNYGKTGVYEVSTKSKAGIALMIVGYILIVAATVITATRLAHAEPGEKRVLLAVAICLPFILVRIIYSAESVFGHDSRFSQFGGDPNILLGTAVLMEMIVIAIVEGFGLTFSVRPKEELPSKTLWAHSQGRRERRRERHAHQGYVSSNV